VEEPTILTPWTPPLDKPEPRDYPLTSDSAYRMKRSVSPVNEKDTSAVTAPGEINAIITKGITPSVTPKPGRERRPRKNPKKDPQMMRPSKIVSFITSNYLEMKSSKW